MWSKRLSSVLDSHAGPIVFVGNAAWGIPRVIAASSTPERPLVWLELAPRDAGDHVSQGDKLADAVKRALGGPLIGYGLPFSYGLAVLKTHLELLGPFTFALSGAEHGAELARALPSFQQGENRVVLHFHTLPEGFLLPEKTFLLGSNALRLTREEALGLACERLPEGNVLKLWEVSGGVYEAFLVALHSELSLALPLRPGPEGAQPIGHELGAALLDVLLRRERWLEALEVAAQRSPEQVPVVLGQAGEKLWMKGYQSRLYPLLSNLPGRLKKHETVLSWRLQAAIALGKEREVLPEVEELLETTEAPDLRAIYAEACFSSGDVEGALDASEQALASRETPMTLYTRGRFMSLQNLGMGSILLEKGLRLAEKRGEPYFVAQIAGALATQAITSGRYRTAVSWAEWGLKLYYQEGMSQETVRLSLLNERVFASILLGQTAGMEAALRQEITLLTNVQPSLARLFRSTLADLLLSQGKSEEALLVYWDLWRENTQRGSAGGLARMLVRALLDVGETKKAQHIAAQAVDFTKGLTSLYQQQARLADGMVLSFTDPEKAVHVLEPAVADFRDSLIAPFLAQAGLHVAKAHLQLGEPEAAKASLERAQAGLAELEKSGLRYLAGPPRAFYEVFSLLENNCPALELNFLGATRAYLRGEPLKLRLRLAELLMVLAAYPEGLTGEQLTLAVYGESGDPKLCKVEMGRLRQLIPVSSRPYRLEVDAELDYQKVKGMIQAGRLPEAVTLYKGPLLPNSQAPKIVELRSYLEEALRQAVLNDTRPAILWVLAETLEDDLELWEATLASLTLQDPRYIFARAKVGILLKSWDL